MQRMCVADCLLICIAHILFVVMFDLTGICVQLICVKGLADAVAVVCLWSTHPLKCSSSAITFTFVPLLLTCVCWAYVSVKAS